MNAKENKRKLKAQMIVNTLEQAKPNGVPKKVILSHVCLEFGAGKRYVNEIVQDLLNLEKIKEESGVLFI